MQYIFKTKATLFLAHSIFVLVWETADVLHRKYILDACVIGTRDNFHQNVYYLFQNIKVKKSMKNKCLGHFHSAYKLKYSARMFAFALVEFLLLLA